MTDLVVVLFFFFFFQAEDGIRDIGVTGVQTCAIPILETPVEVPANLLAEAPEVRLALSRMSEGGYAEAVVRMMILLAQARGGVRRDRSEERRVGKEGRSRWSPHH